MQRKRPVASFGGVAFEQLGARLHRYLTRRLVRAEAADDLTQEVYLRLLRISNEHLVQCPEAYVYRIASNLLGEFKLHEQRGVIDVDSEAVAAMAERLADDTAGPEEVWDQGVREQWLEKVLAELPPMQRAVFVLAKRQDRSYAEIARELKLSVHTVKKYLFRAIHHCRRAMQEAP